jgi:hypothetical protein
MWRRCEFRSCHDVESSRDDGPGSSRINTVAFPHPDNAGASDAAADPAAAAASEYDPAATAHKKNAAAAAAGAADPEPAARRA